MSVERACTAQARLRFAPPAAVRELCVVVRGSLRLFQQGRLLFGAWGVKLMEPPETAWFGARGVKLMEPSETAETAWFGVRGVKLMKPSETGRRRLRMDYDNKRT